MGKRNTNNEKKQQCKQGEQTQKKTNKPYIVRKHERGKQHEDENQK